MFSRTFIHLQGGVRMVRNKENNFPPHRDIDGEPRAKAKYSSLRANGQINTHPQERMRQSNEKRPQE